MSSVTVDLESWGITDHYPSEIRGGSRAFPLPRGFGNEVFIYFSCVGKAFNIDLTLIGVRRNVIYCFDKDRHPFLWDLSNGEFKPNSLGFTTFLTRGKFLLETDEHLWKPFNHMSFLPFPYPGLISNICFKQLDHDQIVKGIRAKLNLTDVNIKHNFMTNSYEILINQQLCSLEKLCFMIIKSEETNFSPGLREIVNWYRNEN